MYKVFRLSVFLLVAIMAFAASSSAQLTINGEVIDVIDGKTVLVATPGGKVKVELQYIAVPVPGQQLSDTVKEHLRQLAVGKPVEYRPKTLLRDRAIGRLTIKNIDISQQMIRDGAAWHVPMQGSGQDKNQFELYATTEAAAKQDKIGVWSVPNLKPSWELRAEKKPAKKPEQTSFASRSYASVSENSNTRRKPTAPTNPAFGDVGILLNRYDPETGTGLLSTSFMPITPDKAFPEISSAAVDVTYYYKEKGQKKRSGAFVVTVVYNSTREMFPGKTELTVWDGEKKTLIGRPKRTVSYDGYDVRETLICEISRETLEKITVNEGKLLKVGKHMIYLTGARYLLYNLLEVSK